jgi:hypothetical protein
MKIMTPITMLTPFQKQSSAQSASKAKWKKQSEMMHGKSFMAPMRFPRNTCPHFCAKVSLSKMTKPTIMTNFMNLKLTKLYKLVKMHLKMRELTRTRTNKLQQLKWIKKRLSDMLEEAGASER